MYSPVLGEKTVKTLYRLKQFYRKPMTEIAEEIIQKSMCTFDKRLVCRMCVSESNNDCKSCYLANVKQEGEGYVKQEGEGYVE